MLKKLLTKIGVGPETAMFKKIKAAITVLDPLSSSKTLENINSSRTVC